MQEETLQLDIPAQIAQRKNKLEALRKAGNAFPNDFRKDAFAADLHAQHTETQDFEGDNAVHVKVAGRMVARRLMGKASFVHIQDMTGRIQLYVKQEIISPETYEAFKHWDLGDIIAATGVLFKTKTGELSIHVDTLQLLTKSLRPLPDKFHGLADKEMRYRQRYLDLIANEETRRVFQIRSAVITQLRDFFIARRFLEVETPMMHPIPGGAAARPFVTHHNALDMPLYLRIAPELYLKRLVVGGFERVFEINRNFRNEGLSTRHNPEFTMLEFYQAYADYHDLMDMTEVLMRTLTQSIFGTQQITYQGQLCDFSKPIPRMTIKESILHMHPDITQAVLEDAAQIRTLAAKHQVPVHAQDGVGKIQYAIFEKIVEPLLTAPIFITEFPTEVSPLARKNVDNPEVVDRFEFFVAGREIANGFSELNDAEDQAARFKEQVKHREAGDAEAMLFDAEYVQALEYGLPPTAGQGIGIDRLVMLLADASSIRDVILFPQMRNAGD
jgi:lysyl-tRNA synthetase class 2